MRRNVYAALIVTCLITACTTTKTYETKTPTQTVAQAVQKDGMIQSGDAISIALSDGTIVKGKVTDVDGDKLTIDGKSYPVSDIAGLETQRFSAGKTAALIGGSAVAIYAIGASLAILAMFGL